MLYFDEKRIRNEANQDENGAWRWNSNGNYLFVDCLVEAGIEFDAAAQEMARSAQASEVLADYREAMKDYTPSSEEMFEMRAAFGENTEVVNVFTGKKISL